jgi:hypothetical protein
LQIRVRAKELGNNFLPTNRFSGPRMRSAADFTVGAEILPFERDSAPLVGGNDEPLITYLFKYYSKASHIAMLTIRLTNVHNFPQVGGSAQLRIR